MSNIEIAGSVSALLVIDNEGHHLLAKYYKLHFTSMDEELNFKQRLFNKARITDCIFLIHPR